MLRRFSKKKKKRKGRTRILFLYKEFYNFHHSIASLLGIISFYLAFERSQRIYYQPRGFPRNNKWLRVSSDYRIGRGRSRFIGRQHAFALSCASKLFFQRSLVSFSSPLLGSYSISFFHRFASFLSLSLTNFWDISIGKMNNCDNTIFPVRYSKHREEDSR